MKKMFVLATDGDNREDCNVFYSDYILVESGIGLNFSEKIFDEADTMTNIEFVEEIKKLGYIVDDFIINDVIIVKAIE